jgi:hypothetical protein
MISTHLGCRRSDNFGSGASNGFGNSTGVRPGTAAVVGSSSNYSGDSASPYSVLKLPHEPPKTLHFFKFD